MSTEPKSLTPAVLALGFRPFYLLAACFAALALLFWLAVYFGVLEGSSYFKGFYWHSHEMVFGFTSAVMAGFLLTAVRNWTGLPTPIGIPLLLLVSIWIAGRLLVLTGPANLAFIADITFLPLLALVIALPIWRSRNTRNYKLPLVLLGLAACNLLFHLAGFGALSLEWFRLSITAALDLITILMAIVGGRVIPVFTDNAISSASPRKNEMLDALAIGSLVAILLGGVLSPWILIPKSIWTALFTTAAVAHTVRWLLWQPQLTLGNALLWMLPVAYVWIPVSLALRALSTQLLISSSAATHALTLGAVSGLMLAMMMRSALGHTGYDLKAGKTEVLVFLLVQVAVVVRVTGYIDALNFYAGSVTLSGILWASAFLVFLIRYFPILTRARIDGKAG